MKRYYNCDKYVYTYKEKKDKVIVKLLLKNCPIHSNLFLVLIMFSF